MPNVALAILAVLWVWLFLFDRAATCSRIASDWIYALTLAATLWMLALSLIGVPPLLMALLVLPCIPVFLIDCWQGVRRIRVAWQVIGLVSRNRKAA